MKTKRPERILLISPMPPAMGGISVSSARLRDNLINEGYEVVTYDIARRNSRFIPAKLYLLANVLWIPFYVLFHRRFDIIHFHVTGYWRRVWLWMTKPLLKGSPTVMTIHGDISPLLSKRGFVKFFGFADKIILVQPENANLMPDSLKHKCVEIPAFVMPRDLSQFTLPQNIADFADARDCATTPLLVFNGAAVVTGKWPDLYGFDDFLSLLERLDAENINYKAVMIINNSSFSGEQQAFVEGMKSRAGRLDKLMFVNASGFSLLPLFAKNNIVYVRPTKTDGDSLSVREALALGAQVVASDCANRPEGTIIYRLGQAQEFYRAVVEAIDANKGDKTFGTPPRDFYNDIIDTYKSFYNRQ